MKDYGIILEEVRAIIVEVLACELDEVQPSSRFFEDLGGESIDMLDLTFHCEKRFGVRLPLQQLATPGELEADANGRLTADSLARMKSKYSFLDYSRFELDPVQTRVTELITIAAIARFVVDTLAAREPSESGTQAQAIPDGIEPLPVGG